MSLNDFLTQRYKDLDFDAPMDKEQVRRDNLDRIDHRKSKAIAYLEQAREFYDNKDLFDNRLEAIKREIRSL